MRYKYKKKPSPEIQKGDGPIKSFINNKLNLFEGT